MREEKLDKKKLCAWNIALFNIYSKEEEKLTVQILKIVVFSHTASHLYREIGTSLFDLFHAIHAAINWISLLI